MTIRSIRRAVARSAFTVTELVVSVAILGLLVAMLMPAIQSARESSRQVECRSQLHQMGLAVSSFEATHRRLPSFVWPRSKDIPDNFYTYSAHFQLLPYLEHKSLYDLLDTSVEPPRVTKPRQLDPAIRSSLGVFGCPSDPVEGGNNYRVSAGAVGRQCASLSACLDGGAFSVPGGIALRDVQDGLSQSAALSERYKSDRDLSSFSTLDFWYSGRVALPGSPSRGEMIDIARNLAGSPSRYQPRVGHQWLRGDFAATEYNHLLQPNSDVVDCSMDARDPVVLLDDSAPFYADSLVGVHLARSHHPGVVHLAMLDGAVNQVNNSVDLQVWRELGSIASGNP